MKEQRKKPQLQREVAPGRVSSVSWPRRYGWRVLAALTGGVILRVWMHSAFPQTGGDDLIYSNIARNLLHGQYAITDGSGVAHATLIRLPGYPLFLAACFGVFGVGNLEAVAWLQIALELAACLLLADFVRRIASPRAGLNVLWLAALCPFTAVYTTAPLAESLTFDAFCLALWSLQGYLAGRETEPPSRAKSRLPLFLLFTLALCIAALLRPDGALLAVALAPALIFGNGRPFAFKQGMRMMVLCAALCLLPFVPWTIRNWNAFHVFQPLAPRYANDPYEPPRLGFEHWIKTWCLDFTCTNQIYWNVPDGNISFDDLPTTAPNPAYDTPQQQAETAALFAAYNETQQVTPDLNARFDALARERAAQHPWRTQLLLPMGRLADMLFRPRVENLTIDLHWWEYDHHHDETRFSWAYAGLNLFLVLLGLAGLAYRPRLWPYMVAYLVLRSLLLLTIEAPETRYTLEFFPIFYATGGIALERLLRQAQRALTGRTA